MKVSISAECSAAAENWMSRRRRVIIASRAMFMVVFATCAVLLVETPVQVDFLICAVAAGCTYTFLRFMWARDKAKQQAAAACSPKEMTQILQRELEAENA